MKTELWRVNFWYASGIETVRDLTQEQAEKAFYSKRQSERGEYPEHAEIIPQEGGQRWR
jgi:hypothetical protein